MALRVFEGVEYKKLREPLSSADNAAMSGLGSVRQHAGD